MHIIVTIHRYIVQQQQQLSYSSTYSADHVTVISQTDTPTQSDGTMLTGTLQHYNAVQLLLVALRPCSPYMTLSCLQWYVGMWHLDR